MLFEERAEMRLSSLRQSNGYRLRYRNGGSLYEARLNIEMPV